MPFTTTKTLKRARSLRREQTAAEAKLWSSLRGNRLGEHKFRRQVPVGPFIADFLCRERMLIVEVDGATHSSDEEIAFDARRTGYLKTEGYRVLRVLNDDVYRQLDDVLNGILLALDGDMPE